MATKKTLTNGEQTITTSAPGEQNALHAAGWREVGAGKAPARPKRKRTPAKRRAPQKAAEQPAAEETTEAATGEDNA